MSVQTSTAKWNGTLKDGKGVMTVGKGRWESPFTFASRFETGPETNPEELVGAAHAGCYSMFLSALISGKNLKPNFIKTKASVSLEKDDVGPKITKITLDCEADVPGLDEATFQQLAADAKAKCPISRLYAGTEIVLNVKLLETA